MVHGQIRDNVTQASGWLVRLGLRGLLEFQTRQQRDYADLQGIDLHMGQPPDTRMPLAWKASLYEPSTEEWVEADTKWTYRIHLKSKTISIEKSRAKMTAPDPDTQLTMFTGIAA